MRQATYLPFQSSWTGLWRQGPHRTNLPPKLHRQRICSPSTIVFTVVCFPSALSQLYIPLATAPGTTNPQAASFATILASSNYLRGSFTIASQTSKAVLPGTVACHAGEWSLITTEDLRPHINPGDWLLLGFGRGGGATIRHQVHATASILFDRLPLSAPCNGDSASLARGGLPLYRFVTTLDIPVSADAALVEAALFTLPQIRQVILQNVVINC